MVMEEIIVFDGDTDEDASLSEFVMGEYERVSNLLVKFLSRTSINSDEAYRLLLDIGLNVLIGGKLHEEHFWKEEQLKLEEKALFAYNKLIKDKKQILSEGDIYYLSMGASMLEASMDDICDIDFETRTMRPKSNAPIHMHYSVMRNITMSASLISQAVGAVNERILNNKKADKFQRKGNQSRAKKYQTKKEEAHTLFKEGKYTSYAGCAEEIYKDLGVSYETAKKYLYELSDPKQRLLEK